MKNSDELQIQKNREKRILENIILMKGPFFKSFIRNLKTFLLLIQNNYNERFKDLDLKDNDDKILFEYFLLFLGNSDFSENVTTLADMWNEFLIPLKDKEIEDKINVLKQDKINILRIDFDKQNRIIKIQMIYEENIIISNIDNYAIVPLINDVLSLTLNDNLEWSLNKFLRPTKYRSNLFVYKTKDIWQNLLFCIFNSNAYNDIKSSFYNLKQIDFLSEKSIVLEILDNIQFFTFNCIFQGNTISELFRIYENGLFNKKYDQSVSLLIYYALLIITNIHELGGHFYVRFQFFYSLNDGFESPDIEENEELKYGFFGKLRGKESGEKLEIKLFGRVINKITIKEALYILNINNYSQNIDDFKNNFGNCNNINIQNLIDNSLENFLGSLKINIKFLIDEKYDGQYFSNIDFNPNKELEKNEYFTISQHPLGLFEEPDESKIEGMLEIINDLMKANL